MSLTPQLVSMHPSHGLMVSAAGGRAGKQTPWVSLRVSPKQWLCNVPVDMWPGACACGWQNPWLSLRAPAPAQPAL